MSGAGVQSAGTSSAGYGSSASATPLGGAFLRDTQNGKSLGARQINPATKDYVVDTHGRTLGRNYVQAAVQISIHTTRGSSADTTLGNRLATLDRITPNFERAVLAILTDAVKPLIERGMVEVVAFKQFKPGDDRNGMIKGGVYGRFVWRDLTTGQEHTEGV